MFRNTGANVFAKNQMRLAYEDKRDLYCISTGFLVMLCVRKQIHLYAVNRGKITD